MTRADSRERWRISHISIAGAAYAQAQDALGEARQILLKQRELKQPPHGLSNVQVDFLTSSSYLSLARSQFADARGNLEEAMALAKRLGDQFKMNSLSASRAEIEFVVGDTLLAAKYSEQAVKHADAFPSAPGLLARALCIDAAVRLNTDDVSGGEAVAHHAFTLTTSLGDDELRLISLQNLAATAIRRGRPQTGARLLGSIEAWREAVEYRRNPFEEAAYKLLISSLQAQLGNDTETHIAQGRRLNTELAAAEVLSLESGGADIGMRS